MCSETSQGMKKTKKIEDLKISDFPEAVDEANGVRIYGETSYENQMALISHYLHNGILELTDDRKLELLSALREFLSRKSPIMEKWVQRQKIKKRRFWICL